MPQRPRELTPSKESTAAIWLVCVGIGLLFLARGAFQPYAFPLFEHLGRLTYGQIALVLNGYVLAQSLCAPVAGWYADRTSVRFALATSIVLGLGSFLAVSTSPGFVASAVAVFVAGLAFVLGKIALNTVLVLRSSAETLRRSVAKRATLLNLGSFTGNSIALQVTTHVGYAPHAVLLGLLHLPLAIGLGASPPRRRRQSDGTHGREGAGESAGEGTHRKTWGAAQVGALCRNRGFLADALRRFALVLPYGCWGTIIPKYVIDQCHSTEKVWVIYLTSVCTTVLGAHLLAVHVCGALYRRGFKWEWWSMASVLLYCAGLLLLVFARHPVMLPLAIVVFICGEVLMTPCFDETAKKHSGEEEMATCMGLLHLVDGSGRMLGSVFSLAAYGWMRGTPFGGWYWPVVVAAFLTVCSALHWVAHLVGRRAAPPSPPAGAEYEPAVPEAEAVALAEAESSVP